MTSARIGEVDTLFDVLEATEKRLDIDGIYPVEYYEKQDGIFWHRRAKTGFRRIHLVNAEFSCEILEASEAYARGIGKERLQICLPLNFVYNID